MKTNFWLRVGMVFAAAWALPVHALDWEKKMLAVDAPRASEEVRAKFEFKNTGAKAVHILGIETSCGCTVATAGSSEVPAGEKGEINVIFTIGKRFGQQEKQISVMTDESDTSVSLLLKVNIVETPAGVGAVKKPGA